MTIPASILADGQLDKTLKRSKKALLARLSRTGSARAGGMGWSVHEGKARSTNLPDAPVSVWLSFASLLPDPDSGFQTTGFFGLWEVQVMVRDAGSDPRGFSQDKGFEVLSGVVRVLTETMGDLSLDGAVDEIEVLGAEQAIGRVGDLEIAEWLIRFRARHPLILQDRA